MTISTIKMTAGQYLRMGQDPPGLRLELVDGEIAVSPSPTPGHSRTVFQLSMILGRFVEAGSLGEILLDCDTIFGENDVRRPDILFFTRARAGLIGEKKLKGRPDLAVEVVSDSRGEIDRVDKFRQYAKGGVKFYWIIDPSDRTFEAYKLKAGRYALTVKGKGRGTVEAEPFKGLKIGLTKLWWG